MNDSSNGILPTKSPKSSVQSDAASTERGEAGTIAGETLEPMAATPIEPLREKPARKSEPSPGRSAFFVGSGILISRIIGLVRQRIFAHYFGTSAAGDAFSAAFRIPNFLQNIFGEGALSASFIPVYAKLLAQEDEKKAAHVANAVLGLLALITSLIVLVGVLATPYLFHRTRIRRRNSRINNSARQDSLPRRRIFGALSLVSGRTEQPSSFFHLLHRSGRLELSHHRLADRVRWKGGPISTCRGRSLGFGDRQCTTVWYPTAHRAQTGSPSSSGDRHYEYSR